MKRIVSIQTKIRPDPLNQRHLRSIFYYISEGLQRG